MWIDLLFAFNQGLGNGFGGSGAYRGYEGGYASIGLGPNGISVNGPPTVPAIITGPAGQVIAEGPYGLQTRHYGQS